jgi:hypothetical protein
MRSHALHASTLVLKNESNLQQYQTHKCSVSQVKVVHMGHMGGVHA